MLALLNVSFFNGFHFTIDQNEQQAENAKPMLERPFFNEI